MAAVAAEPAGAAATKTDDAGSPESGPGHMVSSGPPEPGPGQMVSSCPGHMVSSGPREPGPGQIVSSGPPEPGPVQMVSSGPPEPDHGQMVFSGPGQMDSSCHPEPGPGQMISSGTDRQPDARWEHAGGVEDGDEVEEWSHEGTTPPSLPGTTPPLSPGTTPPSPSTGSEVERFSGNRSIVTDLQPSAVFLHSFPARPAAQEAGVSLAEPAEPTTNITVTDYYTNLAEPQVPYRAPDLSFTSLPAEESSSSEYTQDAGGDPVPAPGRSPDRTTSPVGTSTIVDLQQAATNHSTTSCAGFCRTQTNCCVVDCELIPSNPPEPCAPVHSPPGSGESRDVKQEPRKDESTPDPESKPEPQSVHQLSAGSEVRVSLDHIIDDALVVSFRVGEKVFSGVLMDLSRRFGPYGIPITVFPERGKQAPPLLPQQEVEGEAGSPPAPPIRPPKPPPLFQDGAPYPPPLLIRDSYNQALPQPPPRKIKRPKRRYRYEDPPTSIMNAIKLRPRQLLCDKCKGVVSAGGGTREARRGGGGGGGGGGGEEASSRRRRHEDSSSSAVTKRLRTEAKQPPPSCPGRVPRGSAPSPRRLKTTRPVLAKAPLPVGGAKALTRAAALQEASQHQKVHFTRRLQQLAPPLRGPLPPRLRIKPQRYRTDDPVPPQATPIPASNPAPSSPVGVASVAVVAEEQREEERGEVQGGSLLFCVAFKAPSAPPASSSSALLLDPLKGPGSAPPPGRSSSRRCVTACGGVQRGVCVGDIVWAKIYGFPWWPARVLARRREEARVSWFGSPTTSFLPLAQLAPFLESFQSRFDRKRKGPYRRAITEAARAAKNLTPEVRALLTQFET